LDHSGPLPLKADRERERHVRFGSLADIPAPDWLTRGAVIVRNRAPPNQRDTLDHALHVRCGEG
jgi:hypothetical protein